MCMELGFSYSSHNSHLNNNKTSKVSFFKLIPKLNCNRKNKDKLKKRIRFSET